jgi:acetylornithine/succinyldiaminopimelate/putrescine aminotransferase
VPFHFATPEPHVVALGGAGRRANRRGIVSDEVATNLSYGDHGTTYGGNLLACRAALTFLTELVEGGVMDSAKRVGKVFEQRLGALAKKHPQLIKEVRGLGLIWGLDLTRDAGPIVPAGIANGVIVNRTAETVVRLLPPLNITEAEANEAIDRLDAALGAMGAA